MHHKIWTLSHNTKSLAITKYWKTFIELSNLGSGN